jgi:HAD superfamily hydrolase (TIGR01484 family)
MSYLVATDLDGTLLRRDLTVSDRTRRALRLAGESGVEVVYATGRPPRWLAEVYQQTGHEPVTVCANGALTLQRDEALLVRAIPDGAVEQVRTLLAALHGDFVFHLEQWRGHTLKMLAGLPEFSPQHADAVLAEVGEVAGHLVEPTRSTYRGVLIEMGPAGVTKAQALAELRAQRWPDRTLIAIGDMPNDAAMLRAADVALTVDSGHPTLREFAERVLPGPDQDGVAQFLEELVRTGLA